MTIHFLFFDIPPPKLDTFFFHAGKHPSSKIEGKKPTPFFFDQKKSPLPATASPDFLTTSDFLYCRARLSGRDILPPTSRRQLPAPPATRGSKKANGNGRRRISRAVFETGLPSTWRNIESFHISWLPGLLLFGDEVDGN